MIDFGKSVKLRKLDAQHDLNQTFAWRNDHNIWKWCRQHDALSMEHHKRWFDWQSKDPETLMYAVTTKDSGLVGVCGFTSYDRHNRRAEFSLYIGTEHQGCGFGEAALKTLFSHGFGNLGLHSIWGESFAGNPAIEMFKKIGMISGGIRREAYFREGRFVDAELFTILESEWNY